MKRKGGRVVSAGTTSVNTAAPVASTEAGSETRAAVASVEVLPSIDVFSRFQSHRDDFDVNWIMAQEDPVDPNAITLSPAVVQKLKLHQGRMGALRTGVAAAAASPSSSSSAGATSMTKSAPSLSATATATSRASLTTPSSALSSSKAPRTVRVDASLEEAAAANNRYRGERKTGYRPVTVTDSEEGEDDEDDSEYNPGEVKVVETTPQPTSVLGERDAVISQKEKDVAANEEAVDDAVADAHQEKKVEDEGLQGDYLSFIASTGGAQSLDASALQAIVNVGAQPEKGDQGSKPQRVRTDEGRGASSAHNNNAPSSSPSPVAVPLWSVKRMERYGGYCASNELVALHQEVMDFVDYLRPTRAEVSIRRYLEREISRLAKKLWPESEVIVYGSLYTHLLLPLSDVDMTLINVPVPQEEALTLLAKEISQADLCEAAYPQVILKTKVPLVKFEHKGSLVPVDISVDATDGKVNSDIVIRLLQLYPQAQPLTTVFKYFLQQRGMDEPYYGGLGSYATTLLVISFLQNHPIYTTNRELRTRTGLGKLLVDFFRYYGLYWNYHRCGVSVEDGGRYFYRDQFSSPHTSSPTGRGPQGPTQALIEDPANSANNAASSLRMLHVISSLFAHAYQSLTLNLGNEPRPPASDLSPDAAEITRRPTLLSRIMHVDAETVYRRQRIATTYAALWASQPDEMREVEAYRRDEDEPLLTGKRIRRNITSELKGGGRAATYATSAERVTLASLRAAAAKAGHTGDGKDSADGRGAITGQKRTRTHRRDDSSDSRSSSSSYSSRSEASLSSNDSSVRKDVSHRTHQRRRPENQSKWKR